MITKEFLSSCTDEQINMGVAWLEVSSLFSIDGMCRIQKIVCNKSLLMPMNYCHNPNDIMPIAFANKFSIEPIFSNSDNYRAHSTCGLYAFNRNPLRAICEVYILMMVEND